MNDIRAALAQAFVTGAFFPAEDIAWENVAFTPRTGNKPWAQWNFVCATPTVASLGDDGLNQINGFVQVDLNYPVGNGDGLAMLKYVDIAAAFKAGARFTYNNHVAVVKSCGRSPGRLLNAYYRVSVTIVFYAQVQR